MTSPARGIARSRTLVLCFDGTSNEFDDTNTNVVKLFGLLKKDDWERQMVYYQAGIGTYAAPGMWGSAFLKVAKIADQAVAWYLDAHVMGGYEFLMQNYRPGDKICLFGFSRGAYTARALAGMLAKVGLLPRDNQEQIAFAYKMYKRDGKKDVELARAFKATFSRTVPIEFVGVWDTVSSVGVLLPRHLPFTSSNHIIRTFRHAIALDEHRAKFQANLWHRTAPTAAAAAKDPDCGSPVSIEAAPPLPKHAHLVHEDEHAQERGHEKETDVEEVWFAGCHSDVGGGSTPDSDTHSLSAISLRWMIREIAISQAGILFDNAALKRAGIPLSSFRLSSAFEKFRRLPSIRHDPIDGLPAPSEKDTEQSATATANNSPSPKPNALGIDVTVDGSPSSRATDTTKRPSISVMQEHKHSNVDHWRLPTDVLDRDDAILSKKHDELRKPGWWPLELIPLIFQWQGDDGDWNTRIRSNLFRGRKIPTNPQPRIHNSVKLRMEAEGLGYRPKAKIPENCKWVD